MNLMQKMERLVDAMTAYYEKQTTSLPTGVFTPPPIASPGALTAPVSVEPMPEHPAVKSSQGRKAKASAESVPVVPAVPMPPAASAGDPLMQAESSASMPVKGQTKAVIQTASNDLTEDQSLEQANEIAKRIILEIYPEKEMPSNRPKGFRMVVEILGKFKVARISDLIHSQRLQFITKCEELIVSAAPKDAAKSDE